MRKEEQITDKSPRDLAKLLGKMADEYSKAGELCVRLKRIRAEFYRAKRPEVKSDAAAERLWELTEEGLELMETEMKMKTLEKKIGAIKEMLRVREFETGNNF